VSEQTHPGSWRAPPREPPRVDSEDVLRPPPTRVIRKEIDAELLQFSSAMSRSARRRTVVFQATRPPFDPGSAGMQLRSLRLRRPAWRGSGARRSTFTAKIAG
jgi:hypothetical protein